MTYRTIVRALLTLVIAVSLAWFVTAHTYAYCGRNGSLFTGLFITPFTDDTNGIGVIGMSTTTTECGIGAHW